MLEAIEFTAVRILSHSVSADRVASLAKFMFLQELLNKLSIDRVIDVGANEGQFARALRYIGYRGPIISFEPLPEVFKTLKAAMEFDRNWTGYNLALGDLDTSAEINVMSWSVYSSFNNPVDDRKGANRVIRTCSVPVRRLDNILGEVGLDHTLLKVDTQGFEMPVFRGVGHRLRQICAIMCEVSVNPLYAGTPTMSDVLLFLGSQGFKPAFFAPVNRLGDLSAIEFDYICVRG
jgi:FkbM family methyltransferase